MIKGICKNVIFVKLGASERFESAMFVVKPSKLPTSRSEMLREASRIISEGTRGREERKELRVDRLLFFICGAATGGTFAAIIWLLTMIFC